MRPGKTPSHVPRGAAESAGGNSRFLLRTFFASRASNHRERHAPPRGLKSTLQSATRSKEFNHDVLAVEFCEPVAARTVFRRASGEYPSARAALVTLGRILGLASKARRHSDAGLFSLADFGRVARPESSKGVAGGRPPRPSQSLGACHPKSIRPCEFPSGG
jgi:hypothetical protein